MLLSSPLSYKQLFNVVLWVEVLESKDINRSMIYEDRKDYDSFSQLLYFSWFYLVSQYGDKFLTLRINSQ